MPRFVRLLTALLLSCMSLLARAEQLRIVTDPWAPYVYEENGETKGIDYEVTAEVFRRLGVDVRWEFMPWKRCMLMVDQGLMPNAEASMTKMVSLRWSNGIARRAT